MTYPTTMQCPPKLEKLNTGLTEHAVKSGLKLIQQQPSISDMFSVKMLHAQELSLSTESKGMHDHALPTESTDSTHGRGLSSFFAQTATIGPLNITTRTMPCGGQSSHFVSAVMPNGTG